MSVLSCVRMDCMNVMCDKYSYQCGYICDSCFEEFVLVTNAQGYIDLEAFVHSSKTSEDSQKDWREECEALFEGRRE